MLPAAQESRKDPDERRIEKEMKNIQDALKESIRSYEVYVEERKINSLDDVKNCVNNFGLSNFWLMYNCNSDFIYLIHIETCPEPFLQYTVKIDKDLNLTVNMEKTPVKKISTYSFPLKVNSYNDILYSITLLLYSITSCIVLL